ncbi:hypothetical protein R6Z07F_005430 [Ovis aries]
MRQSVRREEDADVAMRARMEMKEETEAGKRQEPVQDDTLEQNQTDLRGQGKVGGLVTPAQTPLVRAGGPQLQGGSSVNFKQATSPLSLGASVSNGSALLCR